MHYKNKQRQDGFAHFAMLLAVIVIAIIGLVGWYVYKYSKTNSNSGNASQTATTPDQTIATKEPDIQDTLENPQKIPTSDGSHYFYYGVPAGQNNANPKRIIISLPGHGTTAEDGYNKAWLSHIKGSKYALASLNWWDGKGEQKQNYLSAAEVVAQSQAFLKQQGYTTNDLIILEGFSRGSANSYAVIANDRLSGNPVFDAVISASGGYQSDFPLSEGQSNSSASDTLYKGVYWVLACGGKDDNPNRDGCPAMETTKTFLTEHGATVLGILEDPDAGHGAFHKGSLGLPEKALQMIADKTLQ